MDKKTTPAALPSLKAMAEQKVEGIQKATTFKVDPDLVEFEPGFNLREEGPELDAHLEALYHAMKAGATIPPIDVSVVDGRIIARDGHCRTRMAKRLKAEGHPYQLEARQFRGNEADCVLHMLGSASGKALTPLEAGRGFLRLTKYGLTIPQIADRLGYHRTTIDNGLLLAEAPVEVQQMISKGEVSCQVALEALKKHGSKAAEVLQRIVQKAQEKGVGKVTKKHVTKAKVPAKVVDSFVSAAKTIRGYISDTRFKEITEASDDELNGQVVTVPAAALKAMLTAHAEIAGNEEDEL